MPRSSSFVRGDSAGGADPPHASRPPTGRTSQSKVMRSDSENSSRMESSRLPRRAAAYHTLIFRRALRLNPRDSSVGRGCVLDRRAGKPLQQSAASSHSMGSASAAITGIVRRRCVLLELLDRLGLDRFFLFFAALAHEAERAATAVANAASVTARQRFIVMWTSLFLFAHPILPIAVVFRNTNLGSCLA